MLLRGDAIREPRRVHEWTLMWIGAVLGVGVGKMRKISLGLITLLTVAGTAAAATVIAYRMSWLASPLVTLVPLLLAFVLTSAVGRLKRLVA
jgi:CHASE2 domain-containing sensor protein